MSPGFLRVDKILSVPQELREKLSLLKFRLSVPGFQCVIAEVEKKSRLFLTNREGKKNLPTCEARFSVSVLGVI